MWRSIRVGRTVRAMKVRSSGVCKQVDITYDKWLGKTTNKTATRYCCDFPSPRTQWVCIWITVGNNPKSVFQSSDRPGHLLDPPAIGLFRRIAWGAAPNPTRVASTLVRRRDNVCPTPMALQRAGLYPRRNSSVLSGVGLISIGIEDGNSG